MSIPEQIKAINEYTKCEGQCKLQRLSAGYLPEWRCKECGFLFLVSEQREPPVYSKNGVMIEPRKIELKATVRQRDEHKEN